MCAFLNKTFLNKNNLVLVYSDVPDAKEDKLKQFLRSFKEDFNLYVEGKSWKRKVAALNRELQECDGQHHASLLTYGDQIGTTCVRFIRGAIKEKDISLIDCSIQLIMMHFILRAFVGFGKYIVKRVTIISVLI